MNAAIPLKVYDILKKAISGDINNFICVCDSNKKGEGFSGLTYFVSLQDKRNGEKLHFVIKQAHADQTIREFHPVTAVFLNEIYFYTKLTPEFLKFQEKISPELRFIHLPKCLAAMSDENFERLVLENISFQGFVMHDKKKPLDKDQFELIFKIYGRFHAMSFAYKALQPEEFSKLTSGVIDVWNMYLSKKLFHDVIKNTHEESLKCLRKGVDDPIIDKYSHYIEDGLEFAQKSLINGTYTSIVHGDCWSNNMMFKYDESGKLTDLRLLDFQNVRIGSPVCDISYCLYSGGTKEVFDDLDHLLQIYHDSLSENLRAYGCDPNEIYPLEALKKDWKVHGQLGLTSGLMLWRIKLTYDDKKVDLTDISEDQGDATRFLEAQYDEKTFKEIARDILVHFYENDYLY